MTWAVDIPNYHKDDEWDNVTYTETREAAIRYAQEHYGADENGCICLVSDIGPDEDEGDGREPDGQRIEAGRIVPTDR